MLLTMAALSVAGIVAWQALHRTASLVQRWSASSFPRNSAGSLSVRDSGTTGRPNEEVVLLLHGLGATGDYFGAFYDGLSRKRRVVIVDLLGFGHSLDEDRSDFSVDAHVTALDHLLEALDLAGSNVIVAAHSMSSAIALTWADRHRDRAVGVYLWGPPIYPIHAAAQSVGKEYGVMGRLFALDTKWAERACRVNCWNRDLSGHMMALIAPRWPTEVSSGAGLHTWEAYHGSLRSLILDFDWTRVMPAAVPVTIFHGMDDPIGEGAYRAKLAGGAVIVEVPGADHHVALQHPELLFDALDRGG
jgi:pimeloyl-ACP methyl ester carboxylesterase